MKTILKLVAGKLLLVARKINVLLSIIVSEIIQVSMYVIVPIITVFLCLVAFSHGISWVENKLITGAHAVYIDAVDYIATTHGYDVVENIPVVPPVVSAPRKEPSLEYVRELLKLNMDKVGLDYSLEPVLLGQLLQESDAYLYAVSSAGANGIAQIMPDTARKLGYHPKQMFNLEDSIAAFSAWMKLMLESQSNDIVLALKEYNAGKNKINQSVENREYPVAVLKKVAIAYKEESWKNLKLKK